MSDGNFLQALRGAKQQGVGVTSLADSTAVGEGGTIEIPAPFPRLGLLQEASTQRWYRILVGYGSLTLTLTCHLWIADFQVFSPQYWSVYDIL